MPGGKKRGVASGPTGTGKGHWSRLNLAPVLFLSINGKPANDLLRLCTKFTHKRTLGKSAETKFTFRNDDRVLLDDERLFPNATWQYRFGYFDDLSPIVTGIVRLVAPTYAAKRQVTITLYDAGLNMTVKSSGKNWGKIPSSEIAKRMAKEHGFFHSVEDSSDTPAKSWIQPNDMNDMRYLRDLATLIDYEVFVDGTPPVLYYRKKPYDAAPRGLLVYYDDASEFANVKSFTPKVKSLGPLAAGVASTDANKGKGSKDSSKDPTKGGPGLRVGMNFDNLGPQKDLVVFTPAAKKDVTKPAPSNSNNAALAKVSRQQMLDRANEAESEHTLTPSLRAGDLWEWAGIEKQVNGKWYITEEEHDISGTSSGTKLTWKRNGTGNSKTKLANTNNKTAGTDGGKPPRVQVTFDKKGADNVTFIPPTAPTPPAKASNGKVKK